MALPFVGALLPKIGIKTIAIGLAVLTVAAIVYLGYRHYTGLVEENAALKTENAQLHTAKQQQDATISRQQSAIQRWAEAQEKLQERFESAQREARDARKEVRRLNDLFAEHDLGRLAQEKPGLIERRVNSGTARALRMLECASAPGGEDCPSGDRGARGDAGSTEPGADSDSARDVGGP